MRNNGRLIRASESVEHMAHALLLHDTDEVYQARHLSL